MKNKSDNNDQIQATENPVSASPDAVGDTAPVTPSEKASSTSTSGSATANTLDSTQTSSSPSHWSGKAALVLALAALGLSGYLFVQQQTLHQQSVILNAEVETRLASNATEVARTVATVNQQAASVNQQLGQLQEQTAAGQRNIDHLQERLTQSIQQVQAQQSISETDWLLAEAEYLLRLANQRILMEQNASGALALLASADEILLRANDVALYPVREALAKDMASLQALPRLDTEGLFLRLSALNAQVPSLRLIPVTDRHPLPSLLEEISPESVKESWGSGARETFASAMSKLEQLVVIQHRDEPIQPLLSPEQTYYLQQNLHLMFEQAQYALLQGRQAAYDESLNKASRWIEAYFQANDATTLALLEGIQTLKTVTVHVEIPAINGSLNALQQHIHELRRLKREGGKG